MHHADVFRTFYKDYFCVYINANYDPNNEDSTMFALVPLSNGCSINLLFDKLNLLFLHAYVCNVELLRLVITYQARFPDGEVCESAFEININDFYHPEYSLQHVEEEMR